MHLEPGCRPPDARRTQARSRPYFHHAWAAVAVEFEEGGWKASGLGRLGGVASMEDFVEYKQITQTCGPTDHH
jgi:hypothetical protein